MNPLIETWQIHNRINLYLLDGVDEAHMKDISASKGRSVGEQFAHMHNVRLMWLKVAAAELLEGLAKIEKEQVTKEKLAAELKSSGQAVESLFEKSERCTLIQNAITSHAFTVVTAHADEAQFCFHIYMWYAYAFSRNKRNRE